MSANTAPIKWAQRSDSLYLTIALPDVKNETINLTQDSLSFTGTSQDQEYALDIQFFHPVDAAGSTYKVLKRSIQMHIIKAADDQEEFWPRLLADKALEKNQVTIDWNRYVDQDEEEEGFDTSALEGGQGMGGMPPGMGGMPGMGGTGGMPGMGGMGGMPPGMDMEALMKQMGGMGGGMADLAGGMGGDDEDDDGDDDDGDDDDLPELEEAN